MAGIDVKNDNPGYGLRSEAPAATIAAAEHRAAEHHRHQEQITIGISVGIALLLLFGALYAVHHRRKIARATDRAVINSLATGVRAARAATAKKNALIERVLAQADADKPPNG